MPQKIVIASDHAGFKLKDKIIERFSTPDLEFLDLGTNSDEAVDYPDYASAVTQEIEKNTSNIGILICGSGVGMSIAANRKSFIRAALCITEDMASLARQHNDANILVLGSRLNEDNISLKIVETFLNTEFAGGRHTQRINKINI